MTRAAYGDPPSFINNPHGHHIIFQRGPAAARQYTQDSQRILQKWGIDPFTDPRNLAWAPNAGHTVDSARLMNEALRAADAVGDYETVYEVLRTGGRILYGGWP